MDWNAAAPAAIVGAVVATLGVFLVEMWLKPQLARVRVARILGAEIRLNVRLIDLAIEHRRDRTELVSEAFQLSTRAWDASAEELHYLPESALRPLLLLYNQFEENNRLVDSHSRKADLLLQLEGSIQQRFLYEEYQNESRVFGDGLSKTREQCERTLAHLMRIVDDSLVPAVPTD